MKTVRRFFYDCEFIEKPGSIEMLSIGVIGEDGKYLYAINHHADISGASKWVWDNVLAKLPDVWTGGDRGPLKGPGPKDIGESLLDFLRPTEENPVQLWGYCSAYDHVVLCWLFGRMIDLPKGMPMLTMDIKQKMIEHGIKKSELPFQDEKGAHNALEDATWNMDSFRRIEEIIQLRG